MDKSKLRQGSATSRTVVYEVVGDNVKETIDVIDSEGKPGHAEWQGNVDGKDYPATSSPPSDARLSFFLKKIRSGLFPIASDLRLATFTPSAILRAPAD